MTPLGSDMIGFFFTALKEQRRSFVKTTHEIIKHKFSFSCIETFICRAFGLHNIRVNIIIDLNKTMINDKIDLSTV